MLQLAARIRGLLLLELGLKVFLSYLVGSLNGALLIGWLRGGVDIRKVGSGNAGGTNALRTQGKGFATLVMLVDIGKGVLPVLLLPGMEIPGIAFDASVTREWLAYGCAGAVIYGHCYPVWFEFAGGKGAATVLGTLLVITPMGVVPAMLTWFIVLFVAGYVGLATVAAAMVVPIFVALTSGWAASNLLLFTSGVALFIAFTHRSNLRDLSRGTRSPDVSFSLMRRSR